MTNRLFHQTYVAIIISQKGHALLSMKIIWFTRGPIKPFNGCIGMLPNPFSGVMLVMMCLFICQNQNQILMIINNIIKLIKIIIMSKTQLLCLFFIITEREKYLRMIWLQSTIGLHNVAHQGCLYLLVHFPSFYLSGDQSVD